MQAGRVHIVQVPFDARQGAIEAHCQRYPDATAQPSAIGLDAPAFPWANTELYHSAGEVLCPSDAFAEINLTVQGLWSRPQWSHIVVSCWIEYSSFSFYFMIRRRFLVWVLSKPKSSLPVSNIAAPSWPRELKATGRDYIAVSCVHQTLNRGRTRVTRRPTKNYELFRWKLLVNR